MLIVGPIARPTNRSGVPKATTSGATVGRGISTEFSVGGLSLVGEWGSIVTTIVLAN
jgi:hypothetical protein